jgi:hypothetical protein
MPDQQTCAPSVIVTLPGWTYIGTGSHVKAVRLGQRGCPGRVAAGAGRAGTDVGAGLGPRRGDLDPHLATAIGLSPARVHQLVADADLDALDVALGELRAAGWPAPGGART